MKTSMKIGVAAIALFAISSPALAACPDNSNAYDAVNQGGPFWLPGAGITGVVQAQDFPAEYYDYDPDCSTPASVGLGRAVSGDLVDNGINDNGTPGDPTDDFTEATYEGTPSIVIGPNNTALGNGSVVYANEQYVNAGPDGILEDDPLTVGTDESADNFVATRKIPVSNGTAIGANSSVSHDNSTAIGAGAKSTADNQVTLGTKDETIRAEGITSQTSKDRQQGPVEVVTSDSGGRLATDGGQIFDRLGSLESGQSENRAIISKNAGRIGENAEGIAVAMSMPDAFLDSTENFSIAAGFGGFEGETAFGAIGSVRIDQTFSLYGGGGVSTNGGTFGWKVGARAGW